MSAGRLLGSLGLSFLLGLFLSASVAMIVNSAGTVIHRGWLGVIILAVMVGSFYPIHCLVWKRTPRFLAVRSQPEETLRSHPGTERKG